MDFQEHLLEQETDRLRLFADCVSKIAAVQGQEHDLSQVFSTALNQVVLVISARSAALTLVENNNLCVCAVYGEELNRVEGSIIPRNSEPLWDVVTTTDPYISTYWLGKHQRGVAHQQEYLAVPVMWNGRVRGVIEVVAQRNCVFDETDIALVQTIATILGGRIAEVDRVRLLQAEVARHQRSVGRIAAQYMVTRLLGEAPSFMDVAEAILETIGQQLRWETGLMWCVQGDTNMLACTATWSSPYEQADQFLADSRDLHLPRGVGLPGRVWEQQEPVWVPDVLMDADFHRSAAGTNAKFHAALAFPIVGQTIFFGVIELFSTNIQLPDAELLHTAAALGRQMGQFIERKRAERAQRESELYTRAILETALDGIIAIDHTGHVTEWNPAAERMFGYLRTDALGKDLNALIVPPALRDQHRTGLARYLVNGDVKVLGRRFELPALRADGTEFPVELSITRVPGGNAPRFAGYVRDITERKQAEEAIRFQAHLLDIVEQAVIATDIHGRICYWNRFAEQLYGWTSDEMIGCNKLELFADLEARKEAVQIMNRLRAGESVSAELLVRRRDGVSFPVLVIDSPMLNAAGDVIGMVGVSQDISEAKRGEQAQRFLVDATARLSTSLDYSSTLQHVVELAVLEVADWCTVDLYDDDGVAQQIAGATKDVLKARLPRQEDLRSCLSSYLTRVLHTGQPEFVPQITLDVLPPNALADVLRSLGLTSFMVVPMQARGKIIGAITFASASSNGYDDTDLALVQNLASRMAMAIDNGRLYQNAQAAVRLRDEFLSIASHELKTPLTAMLVHSQALQRRVARQQSFGERDQLALQIIVDQTLRLNKQIATLLDVSRIELGQFRVEQTRVDVVALTTRVVEELKPTLERHTVRVDSSQSSIVVDGDARLLEQVLQNLLGNAVKYNPSGGIISVQVTSDADKAWLSVSDQGMGIPEAARPYLFQRFYRAGNVDAHHISGLGIGLYVVHEIVEQHGGTITVNSTEGQGSTFTVGLPLAQPAVVSTN